MTRTHQQAKARVDNFATKLRKFTRLTEQEKVLLRAASALRTNRGLYRHLYEPEEVEIIARARLIALKAGHVKLSHALILRSMPGKPRYEAIVVGPGEVHRCQRCGRLHRAPWAKLTPAELEREAQVLQEALRKKREEQKP